MRFFCAQALAGRWSALAKPWMALVVAFNLSNIATAEQDIEYTLKFNSSESNFIDRAASSESTSLRRYDGPQPIQLVSATVVEPLDCRTPDEYHPPSCVAPCETCESYRCGCDLDAVCDDCPNHGLYAFIGNDSWRGLPDISPGSANWGLSTGVNFGSRLGALSDATGIGGQIGGSFGVYDWMGRPGLGNNDEAQTQGFFTYGLFRKANEFTPWSASVVQDWMVNNNYALDGVSPTLSQIRVQIGYALNTWNEVGFWGAWHCLEAERFTLGPQFPATVWRSVDQYNAYWHHKWGEGGPDTWVWLGLPENNRLQGPGSLGDFIVGWLGEAPLTDRLSIYGTVTYMHPSSSAGLQGAAEETWNVSFGVAFYPGYNARSSTVAGQCWMPQLPVANNGTFLVDQGARF